MHAVALDRVSQCAHDVLLADHLIEELRAVAAIEGGLSAHRGESSGGFQPPQQAGPWYDVSPEKSSRAGYR